VGEHDHGYSRLAFGCPLGHLRRATRALPYHAIIAVQLVHALIQFPNMADPQKTKQPDDREATKDKGCPVEMHDGKPCGRPIYNAPPDLDETPLCLMHSRDPNKDDTAFQAEFERIVRDAGGTPADFRRFVFLSANYSTREFTSRCVFSEATFVTDADFRGTKFSKGADFSRATFAQVANFVAGHFGPDTFFIETVFNGDALFPSSWFLKVSSFSGATFAQNADFTDAQFKGPVDFATASFTLTARFVATVFGEVAYFSQAGFAGAADFADARFEKDGYLLASRFADQAQFSRVTFAHKADFSGSEFAGPADFHNASFEGMANFSTATFARDARFMEAVFKGECSFWLADIRDVADFHHATFEGPVEFRETRIAEDSARRPAPVFVLARFEKPENVAFYKTYLGRALFHNCDVSRFLFSNVRWLERLGNYNRMVFEEVVDVQDAAAAALRPEVGSRDERNYGLIAELYQQLKKNYDDRRDYWTAGDFHYGEMEMKRRASPRRNPGLRWLHRNVGLVAWYQYWSDYGENYVKPFLRLALVLALFSLIYPACGLRRALREGTKAPTVSALASVSKTSTDELSYSNFFQFIKSYPRQWEGTIYLLGHSMMAGVGAAALRRDFAAYEPASQWGRVAALVEFLLTSTLIALFLLAVRRQFRR